MSTDLYHLSDGPRSSRCDCSLSDAEMLTFLEKYGWKIQREDEDDKRWWECCNLAPHGYGEGDTLREAIRAAYAVHLEEGGDPVLVNAPKPERKDNHGPL